MYRAMGSLAFVAAARAAWVVARDRDDPARRLLLPLKNNLAREMGGLAFSILDGAVAWEPNPVGIDADAALTPDAGRTRQERDEAADWLREVLTAGPMASSDVRRLAEENGFSWGTVRRAKNPLGVRVDREGFGPGATWRWSLPDGHRCAGDPIDAIDAQHRNVSTYGERAHLWSPDPQTDRHRCAPTSIDAIDAQPRDVSTYGESERLCDHPDDEGRHRCAGDPIDAIDAQHRNVSTYGERAHLWSPDPQTDRHRCAPTSIDAIDAQPRDVSAYASAERSCEAPTDPACKHPDAGREVLEL